MIQAERATMSAEKIGKFAVLETLGAGANSTILKIRRDADGKEYALKMVTLVDEEDKKFLEQAKHEVRISAMLNHPNLIKIHQFETESDWLFRVKKAKLLVEYVNGKTLDQFPMLKMAKLLRIFERVANGLAHMHKNGVLHADLKPNNIMVGRGTTVKIIDYGLAWVKGEAKDRLQGTPEYMAPETVNHKIVNERTDIYNFGATMYRAVTLKLPPSVLPNEDGIQITEKMFEQCLTPVCEINKGAPEELGDLIHRCLQYNALKRPERASELQGILDRLADEAAEKLDPSERDE
ncbi:MAG: serine/threonine protein kinase [Gemmataceae bacterium]